MNEIEYNTQKIIECLKTKRRSKTEISNLTGIHFYLIDDYLKTLIKNKLVKEEKNKSGKYTYYKLR